MKIVLKYKVYISVIPAFVLLTYVNAQMPHDSLTSYLEIAASKNPEVLQRYDEYQASVRRITPAGSLQDPDLSIGVFLSPMEIISGKQFADIRLMQMFPWFGTLKAAKDEMSQMANANFEALRASKLQVFYNLQSTWYELIKTRESIRISEENIDLLRTIENLAIARYKSGGLANNASGNSSGTAQDNSAAGNSPDKSVMQNMGTNYVSQIQTGSMQVMGSNQQGGGGSGIAELYRIEIEINDMENNIALLKDKEKTITARFNSYLDRNPSSKVFLPDSVRAENSDFNLAEVTDSSFSNNPMLVMLKYEGKSVEARKKMVSLMGYPMTGLGVNYSIIGNSSMSSSSMNGKDMIMPMVSVTLPIYRKKYKAMKEETAFQQEVVSQNYKATINSLQAEFYEAMQFYQDAGRRMDLYNKQSLLMRKSFDIMLKSFASAGTTLTDLLQVRRELADYDLKKIEAITDYNTSIAWIKKLMASQDIL
jgi:outer membrane protein TolC